MAKTKQKSRAGKKVSVFFIVFIIIEMLLVAGTAYVFRNEDVTPSFAGYSMFVMDSENMNGIPKDALFVVENGSPSKDQIGKPVLCENVPEIGSSIFLLLDRPTLVRQGTCNPYTSSPSSFLSWARSWKSSIISLHSSAVSSPVTKMTTFSPYLSI